MPVAVIRPNADISGISTFPGNWNTLWWAEPATLPGYPKVSDDNDSTYLRNSSGISLSSCEVGLENAQSLIPEGHRILRTRVIHHAFITNTDGHPPGNQYGEVHSRLKDVTNPDAEEWGIGQVLTTTSLTKTTLQFPWLSQPFGSELTRDKIAALQLVTAHQGYPKLSPYEYKLLEILVELEHKAPPSTVVDSPTGAQNTTRPTISWTHSHEDGEPQSRYRIKVFSEAQYTAPGFDPTEDEPVWEVVEQSTDTSRQMGISITNGLYRAYVSTGIEFGTHAPFFAPWAAYSGFEISVVTSPLPVVSLWSSPDTGSIAVTLAHGSGTPVADEFRLQRSLRPTGPWADLGTFPGPTTFIDHGAAPNTPVYYRANSAYYDNEAIIESAWTNPISTTLILTKWLLKDTYADVILELDVEQESLTIESGEDKAAFNPLGHHGDRKKTPPIVVKDSIRGDKFPLTLGFLGDERHDIFLEMRESQRTLILMAPVKRGLWYMTFNSPVNEKILNMNDPVYRQINCDVIEVDQNVSD